MAPIPTRRLTLLDAMILVVALAAALPATKQVLGEVVIPWFDPHPPSFRGLARTAWHAIGAISRVLLPGLDSLTIAVTALQWRRPKLTFRMLGRRPGLAACAAATVVLLAEAILGFEREGTESLAELQYWWLPLGVRKVGGVVLGAWIAQALSGRRRWGRDGLDKLGQVLGICWIISYLSIITYDIYE